MPPPSLNDHRINFSITRGALSIICSTYQPVISNSVNCGLYTPENAIIKSVKDPVKVYKNCKIFVRSRLLIQVVSLLLRQNCYWTRVLSVFCLNGLVVLWFERAGFKRWTRVHVLGQIVFFHLEFVWIPFLWKSLWRAEVLHENFTIFVRVREVSTTLKPNYVFFTRKTNNT